MKKILEVENLKKVYQKADGTNYTAVKGISFYLNQGEIFSFLGPNGAGKSTTINLLTTQLSPTEGIIKMNGENIFKNSSEVKQKIGIVAQHNNLDRSLTAFENLLYHGKYFGMSTKKAQTRALELLEEFGLMNWKDDYVKSFSGGMVQRLKIARAIMHEPTLLFLDEPTTGLDPSYREILWEQVLRLNKENKTTVFLTTHYMEEPERFSDRVAIYSKGEIKAVGTIEQLRHQVPAETMVNVTLEKITGELKQKLEKSPLLNKVTQVDDQHLIIYAKDHEEVLSEILQLINESKSKLENIQMKATTLDDIFIYLTEQKEVRSHE